MDVDKIVEWAVAFLAGVISSVVAELLVLYFNANGLVNRALRVFTRRRSLRRLRDLQKKAKTSANDPQAIVRAEWACALYDLWAKEPESVKTALKSLNWMADMLDSEEREITHEALKLRYAANQNKELDSDYLNTMHRIRA